MKLIKSFLYAFNGFKICLSSEINFRIHVVAALVAAAAGICLHINRYEWFALLLCSAIVIAAEMINTAIEKICNMLNPDYNPAVKQIKDVAAAAVLLCAFASVLCGLIIFIPKLL